VNALRTKRIMREEGFTLIEVIIALVILSVGLLAIAQMEFLKVLPIDDEDLDDNDVENNGDLTDTEAVDHTDPASPIDGKYSLIWNVADSQDAKSVTVVVTWLSSVKRLPKEVVLPTVFLDQ